jgi:hypothetical protein
MLWAATPTGQNEYYLDPLPTGLYRLTILLYREEFDHLGYHRVQSTFRWNFLPPSLGSKFKPREEISKSKYFLLVAAWYVPLH